MPDAEFYVQHVAIAELRIGVHEIAQLMLDLGEQ